MRRVLWGRFQSQPDGLGDGVVANLARRSGPGLVMKPVQPMRVKTAAQIALFSNPSAAANTMRARRASACPVFLARTNPDSSARSVSLKMIATAGLPIRSPANQKRDLRYFAIGTLEPFPFRLNRNGAPVLYLVAFRCVNRHPLYWKML